MISGDHGTDARQVFSFYFDYLVVYSEFITAISHINQRNVLSINIAHHTIKQLRKNRLGSSYSWQYPRFLVQVCAIGRVLLLGRKRYRQWYGSGTVRRAYGRTKIARGKDRFVRTDLIRQSRMAIKWLDKLMCAILPLSWADLRSTAMHIYDA